jgi:hypothetical protein
MSIHFTVRLSMAAKRNRCRLLEACETKLFTAVDSAATGGECVSEDAPSSLMRWCLPGKETGALEDVVPLHERVLLETWTKIGTADPSIQLNTTDRTEFIERRRHINEKIENGVDVLDVDRNLFATFLSKDMPFTNHTEPPSPLKKWQPPK